MMTDDIVHGGTETDCAVGTIVWVRRRNGSWWPGRILGPNELSASHLMSPRSGTPVKLLGREDASVDWYNLEKSKRVKAFRCGEFDDCIERAESSQGAPIKKREKYARREDAILHALELERQLLEKRQQKQEVGSNPATDSDTGAIKKKITGSCDSNLKNDLSEDNPKHANTKSTMDSPLHGQKSKLSKLLSLEEVNAEVTPRMRGLQDFGLRTAPKKTFSKSVSANNVVHVVPSGEHSVTNFTSVTKSSLSIKKKRSHGVLNEDYHVKRKDKRRPLIQVMQSTAKVANSVHSGQDETDQMGAICRAKRSKCVYLPADSNDCPDHLEFSCQSEIPQSQLVLDNGFEQSITLTEGKTSSDLMEDSSSTEDDFLGPNTSETAVTYQEVSQTLEEFGEPRRPDNSIGVSEQPENTTDDELDESGFSTFIPRFHHPGQAAASNTDVEVSKWQLKGKRNNRSLSKKHMDALEKKVLVSSSERSNGSARGTNHQDKQKRIVDVPSQRSWHDFYQRNDEFVSGYDEEDMAEDMLEDRRYAPVVKKNLIDWGFSNTSVTSSDEGSPSTWEMDKQTPLKGYWENSCFDPIYVGHQGGVYGPMLFEVDLKVQASYHGEHVPLVSLMSRLNGKAIVGHPLQIEILVDGSSHLLLSESGVCSLLPSNDDENAPLTPVWRTARRTTMHRVPRSHPSSTIDGEEAEPQYMDPEISHPYRKSYGGNYDLKTRLVKRSLSHGRRSSAGKKFQKKLLKKVTLSSKKTRTLSSFAMDQKVDGNHSDAKLSGKHDGFEGSIKSEPKAPLVTCIPVKLAFSRITEAIGRSSSSAMGK